ncbi:unnamed protein product, partial [Gulo gulo]
ANAEGCERGSNNIGNTVLPGPDLCVCVCEREIIEEVWYCPVQTRVYGAIIE